MSVGESTGYDNSHPEPLRAIPNRFDRDGGDAVQFPGLPWISVRRLATFILIVPFLVAVAASSEVRRHIAERVRASLLIFICAAGFLAVATVSVLTSISPTESTSILVDAVLSWYVPFFAMIYIARDKNDIVFLLKITASVHHSIPEPGSLTIFGTAAIGWVTFWLWRRWRSNSPAASLSG